MSLATPEEAQSLLAWHRQIQQCRANLLAAAQTAFPFIIPAFNDAEQRIAPIYVAIVQDRISWGEANQELSKARSDNVREISEAVQQWKSSLGAEHSAEVAARSAALDGMATTLNQTANQLQQQQMINQMNRPVTTSCNRVGYAVNCTSF